MHPLFQLPDERCPVLSDALHWMHDSFLDGAEGELFNEVVANTYDPDERKSKATIPWHSDLNELIGFDSTIFSVTTHSPGAFCFAPNVRGTLSEQWRAKTWKGRVQKQIAAGVRGVLPLFPGDLVGMWGEAQVYLQHKTLAGSRICEEVIQRYPAVNNKIRPSVANLLCWIAKYGPSKRGVITFRTIVNHYKGPDPPRCLCLPWISVSGSREMVPPPRPSQAPPAPPLISSAGACWTPALESEAEEADGIQQSPSEEASPTEMEVDDDAEDTVAEPATKKRKTLKADVLDDDAEETVAEPEADLLDEDAEETVSEPTAKKRRTSKADMLDVHKKYIDSALQWYLTANENPAVFLDYLQNLTEHVDGLADEALPDDREMYFDFIEKLSSTHAKAARRMLAVKIITGSNERMQRLREKNEGDQCFREEDTPAKTDKRWTHGVNSCNTSRTFRILAPLGYVINIFKKADLDYFHAQGGIRCHWRDLEAPATTLYNVKTSELKELRWHLIGGPWVEIRTLELDLDYMTHMRRYQILQVKSSGMTSLERLARTRSLLDDWADVLVSTKEAQMQIEDEREWPPPSHFPWEPKGLSDMPVVVWLRRQW